MLDLTRWLAWELYAKSMLLVGRFRLSSGNYSSYYFDLRRLYSYPDTYARIIRVFADLVCRPACPDMIVGVATAGIPLAAMTALVKGLPMGYVRIKRKTYGGEQIVEGVVAGRRVVVVDDVATTGRSIAEAVESIRSHGGVVGEAAVIIDREEGAAELLGSMGVRLRSLTRASLLLDALRARGIEVPADEEKH